ncbi:cuticlin-1 isoform X2 [Onthophagus taurus]|uniref:cuticlin-1 isoform X2 n=1 Tax=Onthophagus taurus TaxID=166361 RepID=UPI000C204761|nr:uncharacterized protein LOC111423838 isoform X2 [Onthophagus taurus]
MMHRELAVVLTTIVLVCTHTAIYAANIPVSTTSTQDVTTEPDVSSESDVKIDCNNDEIVVSISTNTARFNGMIYPDGLTKTSPCFGEYIDASVPVKYKLPLRACNTMSIDRDDGSVEYYNTIVVQPHLKLVTNQGKGFVIRCWYQSRNNTVVINEGPKVDYLQSNDLANPTSSMPMPGCTMRIFSGDPSRHEVAEAVDIGDPLSLEITLDEQDIYGIRVADCYVTDGIGSGEQQLINEDGCPLDPEIMGMFEYSEDKTKATVQFQAHRFPSTFSVYYQCHVRLCLIADGGCEIAAPQCDYSNRKRRQADGDTDTSEGTKAIIEVYSGLYVNDANDLSKGSDDSVFSEKVIIV